MKKTFKKILSIAIVIMMLFSAIPMANMGFESLFAVKASAEEEDEVTEIKRINEEDLKTYGDYIYYVENNEVTIFYYIGDGTEIIIPSEIDGMPVRKLRVYSFHPDYSSYFYTKDNKEDNITNLSLRQVEKIYIPDSVFYIGDGAFSECEKLEEVRLSENLRRIGYQAFGWCSSLTSINITSKKLEKVEGEFLAFTPITDIVFPGGDGTELTIDENAFVYSNVKNVTIQSDFVRLENNCFYLDRRGEKMDRVIVEGEITYCAEFPFEYGISGQPNVFIVKNKPIESVYFALVGRLTMGYIDNYQNKGWTYFASREEIEWLAEGDFRYFINEDKAIVTEYTGEETGTLIVPDTLGGKPVTEIGHKGMRHCPAEYIKLPDTIENIGIYAFTNCYTLKTVTFNDNIKKMPDGIFDHCLSLSQVTAPGVTEICPRAFSSCVSLESVQFSDELHTVGMNSFYWCEKLNSIGVSGEKITALGSGAFKHTAIESFVFSDELTEIPDECFEETPLTSVVIPANVEIIGINVFLNCKKLESVVLPDNLKIIGEGAFCYCESLKSIELPDNLKIIGDEAFRYCESLKSIELPESLVKIGDYAFEMCENLSGEIRLEKNLIYVGYRAFSNTNLTELYYNVPGQKYIGDDKYTLQDFGTARFEKITIGNDVKAIPNGIFRFHTRIKTIVIPDSVEYIGVSAFYGCDLLTEFTVPKNIKSLGQDAIPTTVTTVYFNAENCEFNYTESEKVSLFAGGNIENVIIGDTVERIPDYFFCEYDYDGALVLPDSVTEIGKFAFKNCPVKSVTLPECLVSIEEGTFWGSDIELPENPFPQTLRMIGKSAFKNCDSITELYIPDSVLDVDDSAFYDCDNLVKVRMSPNVKLIPQNCFRSCDKLTTFEWNSDIKLIGEYAFADDTLLVDFDFIGVEKIYPNSFTNSGVNLVMLGENKNEEATELEVVEVSSFENCGNLETLSVGGNVTTIESAAFANCGNLETAVISPTVVDIANDAFDGCDSLTIYCVEDSYVHEYARSKGIPVSTFVIDAIPNHTYTGKEIKPQVNVKVSGEKLTENTDFTVNYSNNINVGTAKVLVSGKGIYKVLASTANFTIITKNIGSIVVAPVGNQAYTGAEIKPQLVVTNGEQVLKEGVDYTVTYKNNTEVGTATAEITGIGNYSGKTSVNFEIAEQSFWQRIVSFFQMLFKPIKDFFDSIF